MLLHCNVVNTNFNDFYMILNDYEFLTFAIASIALILMIINRKRFGIKKKMMIKIFGLGGVYSLLVLMFMYILASL